jgi:hypothetical protein
VRGQIWKTVFILFAGAVIGTLAGQLLGHQVPLFRRMTTVQWHPQADLAVLRFSLDLTFRVNWLTLVGVILAFLLRKKLK